METCEAAQNRYTLPAGKQATCIQCEVGERYIEKTGDPECSDCSQPGYYVDSDKGWCRRCGNNCHTCSAPSKTCSLCQDSKNQIISLDGINCVDECGKGQMAVAVDANNNPQRRCQTCQPNCVDCEESAGCLRCQDGYYKGPNDPKSCLKCILAGCSACSSSNVCSRCSSEQYYISLDETKCVLDCTGEESQYKDEVAKRCRHCESTPNCLRCDNTGKCLECKLGKECKTAKSVEIDFFLTQLYDPKNQAIVSFRMTLEEQEGIATQNYQEIESNMLKYADKLKMEFPEKPEKEASFVLERGIITNEFFLRVKVPRSEDDFELGELLKIDLSSFRRPLDSGISEPKKDKNPLAESTLHFLKPKRIEIQAEIFKIGVKTLAKSAKNIASVSSTATRVGAPASIGLGVAFSLLSNDPNGVFLKFNQFLTLLERLKLFIS